MYHLPGGVQGGNLNAASCAQAVETDGHVRVKRSTQAKAAGGAPSHRLVVSLVNTDPRLVDWLSKLYGGKLYPIERVSRRDVCRWDAEHQVGYEVLSAIRPFLCQKLPAALLGLAFREHKMGWKPGKKLTSEEVAVRDAFRRALSAFNEGTPITASTKRTIAGSVDEFDDRFLRVEPYRFEHPLSQTDWGMLARLFDYDGTAWMRKEEGLPGRRSPKFSLAPYLCVGNWKLAESLAKLFDVGSPREVLNDDGEVSTYRITFYSRTALPLLRGILPHSFKAGAVEIMIEFQRRNHRHGSGGPGNTLPKKVLAWRDAAWRALGYLRDHRPIPDSLQVVLADGGDFSVTFPRASALSDYYATMR